MQGPTVSRRSVIEALSPAGVATFAGCNTDERPPDEQALNIAIDARQQSLIDEPGGLVVNGVADGVEMAVTATTTDEEGRKWASEAVFTANGPTLQIDERTPDDGTWTEADPFGLFWSKQLAEDSEDTVPFRVAGSYDVDVTVEATTQAEQDSTTLTLSRYLYDQSISRETVDDGVVQGEFARPSDDTAGPGILLLHGSFGGPWVGFASLLASRGYPTLALHYFGTPEPLPDRLFEVPVENVLEAVTWLSDKAVVTDSVVIAGKSKGGELALLTGSIADDIDAAISYAGSGVVYQGIGGRGSSWTRDGEPINYVPYASDADFSGPRLREAYDESLDEATAEQIDAATIPVEEIDGDVLLFSPEDDAMWSSVRQHQFAADRLEANGRSFEHVTLADAGHWMVGRVSLPSQHTNHREGFAQGGSSEGNARANLDSWARTRSFLADLESE